MHRGSGLLLAIVLLLTTLGCAGLIIRDSDSPGAKVGKFTTRLTLGITTLGMSELVMADAKREDAEKRRLQEFYAFLNSNVGKMTLDDAVVRWGPPLSRYEGDELVVAEWNSESTSQLVAPIGNMWVAVPVQHGWQLRLSFEKSSRKLSAWNYKAW